MKNILNNIAFVLFINATAGLILAMAILGSIDSTHELAIFEPISMVILFSALASWLGIPIGWCICLIDYTIENIVKFVTRGRYDYRANHWSQKFMDKHDSRRFIYHHRFGDMGYYGALFFGITVFIGAMFHFLPLFTVITGTSAALIIGTLFLVRKIFDVNYTLTRHKHNN